MNKHALINQLTALTVLFFAFSWLVPINWAHQEIFSWLWVALPVILSAVAFLILLRDGGFLLLPVLSVLVSGVALQFLPRTSLGWLAFLITGGLLALVITAQVHIAEGSLAAFVPEHLFLTLAAYALYLVLAAALRFAPWTPVLSALLLWGIGSGFAEQILFLQTGKRTYSLAGWALSFVSAQMFLALNYLPVNGLLIAVLTTGILYFLLTLTVSRHEQIPWGNAVWRAAWLPALWTLAVWLLV